MSSDQATAAILRQLENLNNRLDEIAPRVMAEAFTLDQIAKRYKVSKDTVKRWTLRGDLPTFQHGSVIRVRRTDLDRFDRKHTRFA